MNYKRAKIYFGSKHKKDISKEWYVYYSYRDPAGIFKRFKDRGGINRYHSISERTKQAEMLRDAINLNLESGFNPFSPVAMENIPFVAALRDAMRKKESQVSHATKLAYSSGLEHIVSAIESLSLQGKDVRTIKRSHIKSILYKLKETVSVHTLNKYMGILKTLFTVILDDHDEMEVSPVHGIKAFGGHVVKGFESFPQDIKERLIRGMYENSYRFGVIGETIYDVGIRADETLKLKWEDLLPGLTIRVTREAAKTSKLRYVGIKRQLLFKYLRIYIGQGKPPLDWYIFRNRSDLSSGPGPKPLNRNRLSDRFREVREAKGVPAKYKLYGFKHTGADDKILAGIELGYLQTLYGHHSPRMTERYARKLNEKAMQEIREKSPSL